MINASPASPLAFGLSLPFGYDIVGSYGLCLPGMTSISKSKGSRELKNLECSIL